MLSIGAKVFWLLNAEIPEPEREPAGTNKGVFQVNLTFAGKGVLGANVGADPLQTSKVSEDSVSNGNGFTVTTRSNGEKETHEPDVAITLYVAVCGSNDLLIRVWLIGGSTNSTGGDCLNPVPPIIRFGSLYCGFVQVYWMFAGMMLPAAVGVNRMGDPLQDVATAFAIRGLGLTVTNV